jgi:GH43 family beta-xylosidase
MKHLLFKLLLLLVILLSVGGVARPQDSTPPGTLHNPLNPYGGADPWLTYYDGNYYLAATTWASELTLRKSPTLAGLKTAAPQRIYFETDPSRCCNMWAPEFRLLDGPDGERWYFYYTAGTAGTYDNQHTHVLESAGTDPLGPYTYKGRLFDPAHDTWAIDGSVMQLNGTLYFLFSAFVGSKQSLFIAPMSDPWTLGARAMISEPQYPWELVGGNVNEGPVALQHGGKTFIVYSASSCATPDYKLGMLTYTGGDPLSASSWLKNPEPVFQRNDANGVFAPGHNGFFQSPDGKEDWMVYHANASADGGCDGRRQTRVQKINWKADGTPDFGVPVSNAEAIPAPSGDTGADPLPAFPPLVISRFRTVSKPTSYIRHIDFQARLDFVTNADAQFRVQPGLADAKAISIESVNFPGFYLRHKGKIILLSADDGSQTFKADSTWWLRPGLADATAISFEAYNQPGSYIGKQFGILALTAIPDAAPARAREDATFVEEH